MVKGRHIVHLWQARGSHIAAVLEGPQVGMVVCTWHPDSTRYFLSSTWTCCIGRFAHLVSHKNFVHADLQH